MNTAPIDSYEDAAEIFNFGADSVGMWVFLVLAALLLAGFIVRMVAHESRSFAELGNPSELGAEKPLSDSM